MDTVEVTTLCGNVVINDGEEEEGFVCDEADVREDGRTYQFLHLAKVILDKPFNMNSFHNKMAGVWPPVKGMEIHEIAPA